MTCTEQEELMWIFLMFYCFTLNKTLLHNGKWLLFSLVRAWLSHQCLPSSKRGAHWVCVIPHETVWVYATVATNFVKIFQPLLILQFLEIKECFCVHPVYLKYLFLRRSERVVIKNGFWASCKVILLSYLVKNFNVLDEFSKNSQI
jgi:hypothetical protein